MPFRTRDLSILAYAQGFTLWHYKGREDRLSSITAPGYFDDPFRVDRMSRGDWILINGADGHQLVVLGPPGQGADYTTIPLTPNPNGGA